MLGKIKTSSIRIHIYVSVFVQTTVWLTLKLSWHQYKIWLLIWFLYFTTDWRNIQQQQQEPLDFNHLTSNKNHHQFYIKAWGPILQLKTNLNVLDNLILAINAYFRYCTKCAIIWYQQYSRTIVLYQNQNINFLNSYLKTKLR